MKSFTDVADGYDGGFSNVEVWMVGILGKDINNF
jgi:hypothetical protein